MTPQIMSAFAEELTKIALSEGLISRAKDLAFQDARALGDATPGGGQTFKTLDSALERRRRQGRLFAGGAPTPDARVAPASARDAKTSVNYAREQSLFPPRQSLSAGPVRPEGTFMSRADNAFKGVTAQARKLGRTVRYLK